MNRGLIAIASAMCLCGALPIAAFGSTSPHAATATSRTGAANFTADIRSGPDQDLALSGRLTMRLTPSGALTGTLTGRGGLRVSVTGSAHGRALTLSFQLPAGEMTGTGTASRPIRSTAGFPRKGTLSGPRAGDAGSWELEALEKGKGKHPGGTEKPGEKR